MVTLPPPCPTVYDKMFAGPELLAKLGLRPLPPFGGLQGPLGPSSGHVGQGSTGGPLESGPPNPGRGVIGVSERKTEILQKRMKIPKMLLEVQSSFFFRIVDFMIMNAFYLINLHQLPYLFFRRRSGLSISES